MDDLRREALRIRVQRLERRLFAVLVAWLISALVLVFLGPFVQPAISQPSTLRARTLEIVDAKGKPVIRLGTSEIAGGALLEIADGAGKTRVVISGSASTLWVNDKSGEKPLFALGVDLDGPWLKLVDPKGRTLFKAP
jgi:hypothetical protein